MLFVSLSSPVNPRVQCDGFELRLDLFSRIDPKEIAELSESLKKPVILTLRKKSAGGDFEGTEKERLALIESLLFLKPYLIDLEHTTDPYFLKELACFPLLISYHNYQNTPDDLSHVLKTIETPFAHAYKIATWAEKSSDALRMLLFVKQQAQHHKISGICMGEKGLPTRVLGPCVGNFIDYACYPDPIAPGQLTPQTLRSLYHFDRLNPETHFYGLIGNPIDKSIGHIAHNQIMKDPKWNSVYLKMAVDPEELSSFLPLAARVGFKGLSVTHPLKEAVLPFLSPIHTQIGAVNTLVFHEHTTEGYNTDGIGAIQSLNKELENKKMVIIGAGGTARAIAFEAIKLGAKVVILNRTVDKALQLAASLGCRGGSLEELPETCDLLINATSSPLPIHPLPLTFTMDVSFWPTSFLQKARSLGCEVLNGSSLWEHQAKIQQKIWRPDLFSLNENFY